MPGCLLALIIRRQLPRWQQRGARHVRWSPAPKPGKAFLKGDIGRSTNPFQKACYTWGQLKFARNRGQTTGGQVGWLKHASTDFRWGWQSEMRKTRIPTVSSFKTVGCESNSSPKVATIKISSTAAVRWGRFNLDYCNGIFSPSPYTTWLARLASEQESCHHVGRCHNQSSKHIQAI